MGARISRARPCVAGDQDRADRPRGGVLIDAYLPLALASNCRLIKTSTLGRRAYGTYGPPPV
jgi:hypothetical protein